MATFVMFGKYTSESLKEISAERTVKVVNLFNELGGEIKSMYAILGEYDLIFIADLPNVSKAMKASLALNQMLGITFSTFPALKIEEFDSLAGK